jgi:hypothetical protein
MNGTDPTGAFWEVLAVLGIVGAVAGYQQTGTAKGALYGAAVGVAAGAAAVGAPLLASGPQAAAVAGGIAVQATEVAYHGYAAYGSGRAGDYVGALAHAVSMVDSAYGFSANFAGSSTAMQISGAKSPAEGQPRRYQTMDAAGVAALEDAHSRSAAEGKTDYEYGGVISPAEGGSFTYSEPERGGLEGYQPRMRREDVASYHTHRIDVDPGINEKNETFSKDDALALRDDPFRRPLYMRTPTGNIRKMSATGDRVSIRTIKGTTLPGEP